MSALQRICEACTREIPARQVRDLENVVRGCYGTPPTQGFALPIACSAGAQMLTSGEPQTIERCSRSMLDPDTWRMIDWPANYPPMLVVVVDTEAEFDWRHGPRRAMGVASVKCQSRAQRIFERYGVRPTFVLDYPVSSTREAYEFIRSLYHSGACEIGAHLHPWDNPPLVEQATDENSYPGNLPFELERAKLVQLTGSIEENVGGRPRIYKAGRYGVGPATAQILAELGYEIDVSVVPGTDLSREFGPDFSRCGASPYWFGENPALLEIPLSVGYSGLLADIGSLAYSLTMNERLKALHVPGILARLRLVERIRLTPEGISFKEQRRLTRRLLRKGHRVFSFTYHSPSLAPGNTPYVRSEAELCAFLRCIEQYLEFFTGEIGGRAVTPFEVKALADAFQHCSGNRVTNYSPATKLCRVLKFFVRDKRDLVQCDKGRFCDGPGFLDSGIS
jgi:hypothetical protein